MEIVLPTRYPPLWFQLVFYLFGIAIGAPIFYGLYVQQSPAWDQWWVWLVVAGVGFWTALTIREIFVWLLCRDLRCRIESLTFSKENGAFTAQVVVYSEKNEWVAEKAQLKSTMVSSDTMTIPWPVRGASITLLPKGGPIIIEAKLAKDWEHGFAFLVVKGRRRQGKSLRSCQFLLFKW